MEHTYTKEQLDRYLTQRLQPVKDKFWYNKAAEHLWNFSEGRLSEETVRDFNLHINDIYAHRSAVKVIDFVNSFLRQYREFEDYARFNPRPRIDDDEDPDPVVLEDVTGLLHHVEQDKLDPRIDKDSLADTILFLAYTGLRPGNAERLTGKQIITGLQSEPQCIDVQKDQLKIRKRTFIPIHPQLVPVLERITEGRAADEAVINMRPLRRYLESDVLYLKNRPEKAIKIHHLRKFFQQHSAILEMPEVWTNYIMNHRGGRNPVADKHYHNFQSAVYDKYIKYWGPVNLVEVSDSDAAYDLDDIVNELEKTDEELCYTEIQSYIDDIRIAREGSRHLNELLPSQKRLDVDDYTPTIEDIKNIIHIRLEKYLNSIETEEEYNQKYHDELKNEVKRYSNLRDEEERRYENLRDSI